MHNIENSATIPLNNLPLKEVGIIDSLNSTSPIKRRLLDLGLIKGTKIKPILISPSGDPTAFEVRGCLIALRSEDSKKIYIRKDKEL